MDEPFRQAVARAEVTVDHLESTQTVDQGLAGLADPGAGWLPYIGKGIQVMLQMLSNARKISIGTVATLRLASLLLNVADTRLSDRLRFWWQFSKADVDQDRKTIGQSERIGSSFDEAVAAFVSQAFSSHRRDSTPE